jgi:hypothetical protein
VKREAAIKKLEETHFRGNPVVLNVPFRKAGESEEAFKARMETGIDPDDPGTKLLRERAGTVVDILVDVRPAKLCDGSTDWSVPWQAPQDAAEVCKAAGVDAKAGKGTVYRIIGTTERKVINAIVGDVVRRLKFLS